MIRWIYPVILWLGLPLVWLRLQWRGRKDPAYRDRQGERFGGVPDRVRTGAIWFHTVSAGETIAAAPMIQQLAEEWPALPFLVTTMTPTGSQQVQSRLGEWVDHCYAPYDFSFAVERFFAKVQPRLLVLMETELWPNLIAAAAQRDIPILLINARLSERSARGYAKIAGLSKVMLEQINFVACQTEVHRHRFIRLGVPEPRIQALGSVKFDIGLSPDLATQVRDLGRRLGVQPRLNKAAHGPPVWIAASTHPGEEEIVLDSFAQIRQACPTLLLILVPRHPNRTLSVVDLVEQRGFTSGLQSTTRAEPVDVLIGDVMGTLLQLYGLADVAFVGGSLVDVGGHNPIEPALFALPVISGPRQFNFADVFDQFAEAGALSTVTCAAELAAQVERLLSEVSSRQVMGEAALQVVERNRGATRRIHNRITDFLQALDGPGGAR